METRASSLASVVAAAAWGRASEQV